MANLQREDGWSHEELAADRYRSLFENSPDPILIMEGDRFIDCNRAAVDMLGYPDQAALVRLHPSDISPEFQPDGESSFDKANRHLEAALADQSHHFEWMHLKSDGSLLPVEVSLTAIPHGDRSTIHVVWRDLTERLRLETELRHAQRLEALGSLAAGIAHDFNNTLVPIVTYSELLETALDDQPQLQSWAHELGRAGMLASSLVRKLLAVSRKEGEHLMPVTLELGDAVGGALRMLRRLVGEDIEVVFEHPAQLVWVRLGPGDIEQILLNLATNARDALPSGGRITIELTTAERGGASVVRLSTTDEGVGMDAETLSRAFEPFFTTKEIGIGTGLGLSSVSELVTRASGTIDVTSAPGEGTSVVIELPVVAPPIGDEVDPAPPASTGPERSRVLVVEDDVQILRLIADLLDREGFHVFAAGNGVRALEVLETATPDLVVSDVVMPHMSGPQLIGEIRDRGVDVPFVFISGYVDDRLIEHGFDPAAVPLLRKPFTASELLAAVRRAVATAAG